MEVQQERRPRGRPRKTPVEVAKEPRKRGRPRKVLDLIPANLGGRPRKIINADEVRKAARWLPTQAELAAYFDCSTRTMERALQQPEIREAYEMGMAKGRMLIRQSQMQVGVKKQHPGMLMHLGKHYLGQVDPFDKPLVPTTDSSMLTMAQQATKVAQLINEALENERKSKTIEGEFTEVIPDGN